MAKHRTHSVEFKRQVSQEYLSGETLHGLSKRHNVSRNLIRIWVDKFQAGARTGVSKGGSSAKTSAEKRDHIRYCRPRGISLAEGCRLMGIARSTFYDEPIRAADDTAIVAAMAGICDEFEHYGWRPVQAALRC